MVPFLMNIQERHEDMEYAILKSNASIEREMRRQHHQLAYNMKTKVKSTSKALLLRFARTEQLEQERKLSQLHDMQLEIEPALLQDSLD